MEINIKGFIYHKIAEDFIDCFDRYGFNLQTNKFAISDGVSKSFFPGVWAELLIDEYINNGDRSSFLNINRYRSIQKEWYERVKKIVNQPDQKFFVKNLFIQGKPAAATFVGLHFYYENNILIWDAIALGDSFLFFIPETLNNIDYQFDSVTTLSSKKNLDFDNFPDFFDSKSDTNKGKIKQKKKKVVDGTFYLMTDALAEWFISEKQIALKEIKKWDNQEKFEASIARLRNDVLYNDDVAILIIKVKQDQHRDILYRGVTITDIHKLYQPYIQVINHQSTSESDYLKEQRLNSINFADSQNPSPLPNELDKFDDDRQMSGNININSGEETSSDPWQHRIDKTYTPNPKSNKSSGYWDEFVDSFFEQWGYVHDELPQINLNREKTTKESSENSNTDKLINKKSNHHKKPDEDISSITDKF